MYLDIPDIIISQAHRPVGTYPYHIPLPCTLPHQSTVLLRGEFCSFITKSIVLDHEVDMFLETLLKRYFVHLHYIIKICNNIHNDFVTLNTDNYTYIHIYTHAKIMHTCINIYSFTCTNTHTYMYIIPLNGLSYS